MIYSIEEMNDAHFRVFKAGDTGLIFDGFTATIKYLKGKFCVLEGDKTTEPANSLDPSPDTVLGGSEA